MALMVLKANTNDIHGLLKKTDRQLTDFRPVLVSASASEGVGDGVLVTARTKTTPSSSTT